MKQYFRESLLKMALSINQKQKHLGLTLDLLKKELWTYYPEKIMGVFSSGDIQSVESEFSPDSLCIKWDDSEEHTNIIIIEADGEIFLHSIREGGETIKSTRIHNTKENLEAGNYTLIEEWIQGRYYTLSEYSVLNGRNRTTSNKKDTSLLTVTPPKNLIDLHEYKSTKIIESNVIQLPINTRP